MLLALGLGGLWWGSARLDALDRSPLLEQVDRAERSLVVVTGPPRRARYELRVPATMRRFGALRIDEPVLLQLPLGRSPPQGAVLEVLGVIALPRGPSRGFDERTWLRRHGVHVVLHGDEWRIVGHRGGLGGLADRVRGRLDRTLAPGVRGERRAVLVGVVLGEDQGLSEGLRQRFRASGLYHLLAVSGQNVALVAGGVLMLAWLLGIPRWIGELGALAGIGAYVLGVGAQPSVVRAGVAGALGSLAWLTARQRDRWHFLLLGALALLAWNPYNVYDAGFELSFAAVVAIFVLAPRFERFLEGYPMPSGLRQVVAISTACSVAVPRYPAPGRSGERARGSGGRPAPRLGAGLGGRLSDGPFDFRCARLAERLVRGLPCRMRAAGRWAAFRPGPLGRGCGNSRRRRPRGRDLCLAAWPRT